MVYIFFLIIVIVCLLICILRRKHNSYFEEKGIRYKKPFFLIGCRSECLFRKKTLLEIQSEWYKEFPEERISGMFDFNKKCFLVRDLKLIKDLATSASFPDHAITTNDIDPIFGRLLFNLRGKKWKEMRSTLSPAFTGVRIRQMFQLINLVGEQRTKFIRKQVESGDGDVFEFESLFKKLTLDVIATCAYGIDVDSLTNPNNDFLKYSSKVMIFNSLFPTLKLIGFAVLPSVMRAFRVNLYDEDVKSFFRDTILGTMKEREEKGIVRKDLVDILMSARKKTVVEKTPGGTTKTKLMWDDDDLTSQCVIFFFAAFDTVSVAMTFMAYELAINVEVQQKLHKEIDEANRNLHGSKPSYETIHSMAYLNRVVRETLRKWPTNPITERLCSEDYEVQYDDKKFTIEKGNIIYIPIYGIHHDEQYYKDPEVFDPDRFSQGNSRKDTFLTFGVGPRECLGSRFALIEIMTLMYHLLLNFNIVATSETNIPIKVSLNPTQLKTEDVCLGLKIRP